ncbi:MAG: M81 family metallopeptidase [Alphaproteobacteria bacterium]|nr:M81 family metallopeptidase [Alphaproteobacteria bacterium]
MRILIAMMKHETNTFSPIETGWRRFEEWGAHLGPAARAAYEGTAMPMGAYIELAKEAGAEIVTPVAAEAMPSGRVAAAAYEKMVGAILDAAPGCDAAMLDLHGAMVAETTDDGEGTLLERLRARCPGLPIAVTLDLHCNLTRRMVDNCTALIGYKTYPHTDMHVVGAQIGRVLMRALKGEVAPVMEWGNRPILAQTLRMGTDDEPMRALIALARDIEAEPGILAATVFGGFPMADIPEAGISAIVVADGDRAAARRAVDRLLDAAWARRRDFAYRHEPIGHALDRARALEDGPILLLDHADNCGSGGTQDVMAVLKAVIAAGLEDVAVAAVWDPVAVQEMMRAGIGKEITIRLGGRTSMPAIGAQGEPLEVSGRVRTLSDGDWIVRGPMYTGVHVHMGPTAVIDTGKVKIVVVSRHHEPWDQGVFTSVGIDPAATRYLLLKSRIHYRAGFAPIARHTIALDGVGVTTSDNRILKYEKVRRPIYPLDEM